MNDSQNDPSVHFINGDHSKCEFGQLISNNNVKSKTPEPDHQNLNDMAQTSDSQSSNLKSKSPKSVDKHSADDVPSSSQDEIEQSSFYTINSNDQIETDSPTACSIKNRDAENYARYNFDTPLLLGEFKAPPKRSEMSSFLHSPFIKTLDTFSKLSNLLKDDPDDRLDDLFRPANIPHPTTLLHDSPQQFPPPALPEIEAKNPKSRQQPVTEYEYETELKFKSRLYLLERIFLGGLESDSLRRRLWPILLGVIEEENEENWIPLRELYNLYMRQWKSITPDQESRFTSYKEKKSMAERDVVRCDRCHPYFQKEANIETLKEILMCYIMYDFDTGYVQGMTDLAAPLLYIFEDDPCKAFWCFTGVLNLTKKNFEMDQNTVKNLLIKLFKLVNLTDPCFAEFLAENDSDNCYFAFRWLICLFKREFAKADNNYDQLLIVWDTLWSVHAYEKARQTESQEEFQRQLKILSEKNKTSSSSINETTSDLTNSFSNKLDLETTFGTSPPYIIQSFEHKGGDFDDSNANNKAASDSEPEEINQLTNFELFFLSISLAIIRQERDLIFTQKLDASGIIKHFNSLNLKNYLNETLRHANLIWFWLKYDGGEDQLYNENNGSKDEEWKCSGGYDLLND